jgi:hypothetical protein
MLLSAEKRSAVRARQASRRHRLGRQGKSLGLRDGRLVDASLIVEDPACREHITTAEEDPHGLPATEFAQHVDENRPYP